MTGTCISDVEYSDSEMAQSDPINTKLWQNFLLCLNIYGCFRFSNPSGCYLSRILHWKKTVMAVSTEYVLK